MYSNITVCEIKGGNCCLQDMFTLEFCQGPSDIYINALLIKREVTISGYWPRSFVLPFVCVFNKELIIHILRDTACYPRIRGLNG